MSMSAKQQFELEQARREAIRLEQVRRDGEALVAACEQRLAAVHDVAVQQLAAEDLRGVAQDLAAHRGRLASEPDAAFVGLEQTQGRLHTTLARAEARARAWSDQQAEVVAQARALAERGALSAQQALNSAESGDISAACAVLPAALAEVAAARDAAVEEAVRREVVRGLLKTLKDLGFVVAGPQLDAGTVVLEGRLASGRQARFEVSLEGRMAYDLDGYEGRACADDFQKIETTLRDRYGVRLGPPQVVWKNPDRLSKGARDLPTGTHRKG